MRNLTDLPLVSCQIEFLDGHADIASFLAGAVRASWKYEEMFAAVLKAIEESYQFEDVGDVLLDYCTYESWA
ncbi:hypothetical protein AB595_14610 [Massilia sp. WF1]|nr:hypothetical protein AM586_08035 [Massilia sp. WG5]KLU36209.1 hypothetical protein AB595_14610 [Massilia sp. WF1]